VLFLEGAAAGAWPPPAYGLGPEKLARYAAAPGGDLRLTAFGETCFVTQPRFETGDPRYAWLNRVAAVGEGRLLPNHSV
jgi:hypothetical protein